MKTSVSPHPRLTSLVAGLLSLLCPSPLPAGEAMDECLMEALRSGQYEEMTVSALRASCAERLAGEEDAPEAMLESRVKQEERISDWPFAIIPHKPNYFLPVTFNSQTHGDAFSSADGEVDNVEIKFQLSFKFPLWRDLFDGRADLYAAYTNLSFWQAYNKPLSSPFREINHEPEVFLDIANDWRVLGLKNSHVIVGAVHQSNGRSGTVSRSWNRVYLEMLFERGGFALGLKGWYRLPEHEKAYLLDTSGDDNPDIDRYMGYGEMEAAYKWENQVVAVMLRNNLRADGNKGAVQLDWTFPLSDRLKGYVQYFNGYGESLIDYNASVNRLGAGILLTDRL